MSAQAGKDLLLRLDLADTGVYTTVGGLRTTRIAFNAASIDITSVDSADGWRELLGDAGVRSAAVTGSGVFKDDDADAVIRTTFFSGAVKQWQVLVPDFGVIEGAFLITGLDYAGDHDGVATYELSLASAGALSFTAV